MKAIVSVSPNLNQLQLNHFFPQPENGNTAVVQTFVLSEGQFDQLMQLLNSNELSEVVLCYSRAEHFMAARLNTGMSLTAAAAEWLQLTAQLIELQKKNRQKLFLVNADLWLELPKQWPSHFVELGFCPQHSASNARVVDLPLLTACQFVQQNAELQQHNRLLIASSFPLTEQDMQLDLPLNNVLHQHFLQQQHVQQQQDALALAELQLQQRLIAQTQAEHAAAAAELAFQQLQQQSIQQLTELKIELQNKEQNLNELVVQLQSHQQQQAEFKTELEKKQNNLNNITAQLQSNKQQQAELQKENSNLLSQLHRVQLQLEQQLQATKTAEQQLASASKTGGAVESSQLKQLEQENALLLEQLFKVQEQLEQYYLQLQRAKHQASKGSREQYVLHTAVNLLVTLAAEPGSLSAEALSNRAILLGSEFFDPQWYQQKYLLPDGQATDAAEHYLNQGAALGYSPGPRFDGAAYLQVHQDVAAAGLNPLLHFERYGRAEGRVIQVITEGAV